MSSEWLLWLIRQVHIPLEAYLFLASLYVLFPALLYPFLAGRIAKKIHQSPRLLARQPSITIVTPAHNEEKCIEGLVNAIKAQDYPKTLFRHIIIADNCSDDTAGKAIAAGAEVLIRHTEKASDKTQALRYASEYLLESGNQADYIVVIDADCTIPPDFLSAVAEATQDNPAGAYQTYRRVSNASDGALPAMDAAAEELRQVINLGVKDCLGLDAHLHGNGTVYRADLFHTCAHARQEPFADDKAWKATLTEANEQVKWIGNAHINYAACTQSDNFQNQRKRWITGQIEMIRSYSLRMIYLGIRRGNRSAIEFGLSMLQLPRSILMVVGLYLLFMSTIFPESTNFSYLFYIGLIVSLIIYGLLGYAIGTIPFHPTTLLSTGIRTISGVSKSTMGVLFGNKTIRWASLRKE